MSFGFTGRGSPIGNEMLDILGEYTFFVASAGNDNEGHASYWPAVHPLVMAVGAHNSTGSKSSFSNLQPYVLISASGTDIWSSDMLGITSNGYFKGNVNPTHPYWECWKWQGTSFSSPIVAGTAALVLGHEPGLTPQQLQNRIYDTAKPAAFPYQWGSGPQMGFLDAYDAVVEGL